MKAPSLPPLPTDVLELLEAEREQPEVSPELRARVWTQLEARIGPAAINPEGLGELSRHASKSSRLLSILTKPVLISFALGVGLGAALHAAVRPAPPAPTRPQPAVEHLPKITAPSAVTGSIAVTPPSAVTQIVKAASPAMEAPARVPALSKDERLAAERAPARVPALSKDERLAAERALVERAQAALARQNPTGAIEALSLHQTRFPRGALAEEREALFIRALVETEELEAARARAARFRENFPASVFLGAIDAVLRTAPITNSPR